MYMSISSALSLLPALVAAGAVPGYGGMSLIWQDNFLGPAGSAVNRDLWNVADVNMGNNNELQTYTPSNQNLQISGGGTVQLVPRKSGQSWTSARIESKRIFTPEPGRVTKVEASLRMGANAQGNKMGIWPAFWMLGDAVNHGTPWPRCGELDIMEQKNGEPVGYGTAHCDTFPGGLCNESVGRGGTTPLPDNGFHTWTLTWDRTSPNWQQEVITWYKDGQVFNTVTGAQIGDQGVWATLAHSPYFIILNVAVGGDFPGFPNGATQDGYGSMMEVQYVAVYQS